MKFTLEIECDNAAFVPEPGIEIARILTRLTFNVRDIEPGEAGIVRDANGNSVGRYKLEGDN